MASGPYSIGRDRAGVAVSITSITTPGVWFGDREEARRLARECNDYGAKLRTDFPGRFWLFASLPLPNVDDSLKEIEYALDELKANGVGIMTSFGDKWLGDESFTPVMKELNRRGAIVYTHPTVANCCRNVLSDVHYSVVELSTDTTRAIANLVFSGTASRFPNIRFIFSHAGGTMPFIYQRLVAYPVLDKALELKKDIQAKVPGGVLEAIRSFNTIRRRLRIRSLWSHWPNSYRQSRFCLERTFPSGRRLITSWGFPAAVLVRKSLPLSTAATRFG